MQVGHQAVPSAPGIGGEVFVIDNTGGIAFITNPNNAGGANRQTNRNPPSQQQASTTTTTDADGGEEMIHSRTSHDGDAGDVSDLYEGEFRDDHHHGHRRGGGEASAFFGRALRGADGLLLSSSNIRRRAWQIGDVDERDEPSSVNYYYLNATVWTFLTTKLADMFASLCAARNAIFVFWGLCYDDPYLEMQFQIYYFQSYRIASIVFCVCACVFCFAGTSFWLGTISNFFIVWDYVAVCSWGACAAMIYYLHKKHQRILSSMSDLAGIINNANNSAGHSTHEMDGNLAGHRVANDAEALSAPPSANRSKETSINTAAMQRTSTGKMSAASSGGGGHHAAATTTLATSVFHLSTRSRNHSLFLCSVVAGRGLPSSLSPFSDRIAKLEQALVRNTVLHERYLLAANLIAVLFFIGLNAAQGDCDYVSIERRVLDCKNAINIEGLMMIAHGLFVAQPRLLIAWPVLPIWAGSVIAALRIAIPNIVDTYFVTMVFLLIFELSAAFGTVWIREKRRRADFENFIKRQDRAAEVNIVRQQTQRMLTVQLPTEVTRMLMVGHQLWKSNKRNGVFSLQRSSRHSALPLFPWLVAKVGVVSMFEVCGIGASCSMEWSSHRGPIYIAETMRRVFEALDGVRELFDAGLDDGDALDLEQRATARGGGGGTDSSSRVIRSNGVSTGMAAAEFHIKHRRVSKFHCVGDSYVVVRSVAAAPSTLPPRSFKATSADSSQHDEDEDAVDESTAAAALFRVTSSRVQPSPHRRAAPSAFRAKLSASLSRRGGSNELAQPSPLMSVFLLDDPLLLSYSLHSAVIANEVLQQYVSSMTVIDHNNAIGEAIDAPANGKTIQHLPEEYCVAAPPPIYVRCGIGYGQVHGVFCGGGSKNVSLSGPAYEDAKRTFHLGRRCYSTTATDQLFKGERKNDSADDHQRSIGSHQLQETSYNNSRSDHEQRNKQRGGAVDLVYTALPRYNNSSTDELSRNNNTINQTSITDADADARHRSGSTARNKLTVTKNDDQISSALPLYPQHSSAAEVRVSERWLHAALALSAAAPRSIVAAPNPRGNDPVWNVLHDLLAAKGEVADECDDDIRRLLHAKRPEPSHGDFLSASTSTSAPHTPQPLTTTSGAALLGHSRKGDWSYDAEGGVSPNVQGLGLSPHQAEVDASGAQQQQPVRSFLALCCPGLLRRSASQPPGGGDREGVLYEAEGHSSSTDHSTDDERGGSGGGGAVTPPAYQSSGDDVIRSHVHDWLNRRNIVTHRKSHQQTSTSRTRVPGTPMMNPTSPIYTHGSLRTREDSTASAATLANRSAYAMSSLNDHEIVEVTEKDAAPLSTALLSWCSYRWFSDPRTEAAYRSYSSHSATKAEVIWTSCASMISLVCLFSTMTYSKAHRRCPSCTISTRYRCTIESHNNRRLCHIYANLACCRVSSHSTEQATLTPRRRCRRRIVNSHDSSNNNKTQQHHLQHQQRSTFDLAVWRVLDAPIAVLEDMTLRTILYLFLVFLSILCYGGIVFLVPQEGNIVGNSQLIWLIVLLNWSLNRPLWVRFIVSSTFDYMVAVAFFLRTYSRTNMSFTSQLTAMYMELTLPLYSAIVRVALNTSMRMAFATALETQQLQDVLERDQKKLEGIVEMVATDGIASRFIEHSRREHNGGDGRRKHRRHHAGELIGVTDSGAAAGAASRRHFHREFLGYHYEQPQEQQTAGGAGDSPAVPAAALASGLLPMSMGGGGGSLAPYQMLSPLYLGAELQRQVAAAERQRSNAGTANPLVAPPQLLVATTAIPTTTVLNSPPTESTTTVSVFEDHGGTFQPVVAPPPSAPIAVQSAQSAVAATPRPQTRRGALPEVPSAVHSRAPRQLPSVKTKQVKGPSAAPLSSLFSLVTSEMTTFTTISSHLNNHTSQFIKVNNDQLHHNVTAPPTALPAAAYEDPDAAHPLRSTVWSTSVWDVPVAIIRLYPTTAAPTTHTDDGGGGAMSLRGIDTAAGSSNGSRAANTSGTKGTTAENNSSLREGGNSHDTQPTVVVAAPAATQFHRIQQRAHQDNNSSVANDLTNNNSNTTYEVILRGESRSRNLQKDRAVSPTTTITQQHPGGPQQHRPQQPQHQQQQVESFTTAAHRIIGEVAANWPHPPYMKLEVYKATRYELRVCVASVPGPRGPSDRKDADEERCFELLKFSAVVSRRLDDHHNLGILNSHSSKQPRKNLSATVMGSSTSNAVAALGGMIMGGSLSATDTPQTAEGILSWPTAAEQQQQQQPSLDERTPPTAVIGDVDVGAAAATTTSSTNVHSKKKEGGGAPSRVDADDDNPIRTQSPPYRIMMHVGPLVGAVIGRGSVSYDYYGHTATEACAVLDGADGLGAAVPRVLMSTRYANLCRLIALCDETLWRRQVDWLLSIKSEDKEHYRCVYLDGVAIPALPPQPPPQPKPQRQSSSSEGQEQKQIPSATTKTHNDATRGVIGHTPRRVGVIPSVLNVEEDVKLFGPGAVVGGTAGAGSQALSGDNHLLYMLGLNQEKMLQEAAKKSPGGEQHNNTKSPFQHQLSMLSSNGSVDSLSGGRDVVAEIFLAFAECSVVFSNNSTRWKVGGQRAPVDVVHATFV
ncbi:transmembrane protein, putative [Bodo saltans]|uniref:Transmembrane protein, putative n=1 Tax=Bodo saltans TaxID=75058 RepID=A0A0S4KLU3_BODSA|nr:transmembrane protein, putative [Bodo saltans]|eukprot:CUI15465.1 transmembrane protein, putative [Bodo saltans]